MRYLIIFLLLFFVSSTTVIANAAEETGERKIYYCEREDGFVFKSSTECKFFQRNYKQLEITHEEFLTIKEKEDNTQVYCLGSSAILYGPIKGSAYSYFCSVGGVAIKPTELVDGKIINDVKIKFCEYGEGKKTTITVDTYGNCTATKEHVCNVIKQGNYDKNYQTSIDRINEVVCSLHLASDETINNQNKPITEEANVKYCKRYDGKVFERKDDCGSMSEIAYEEYVKGDTLSELPMCEISSVDGSINTRIACFASITYPSGSVYTGEFKNSRPYGQGTKIYSSGNKYVGEWKHRGKRHGYGTFIWVDGNKYVGEWNRGKQIEGTVTFGVNSEFHGDKYVGQFKESEFNGQGTYTKSYGDKYIGEFKDSMYHGQGTYTRVNGDKWVGEFKLHKATGQATITFVDGDKYVGQVKEFALNGQGTYTYSSGEKYIGEWKDSMFHGQGTFTYANGRTDSGKWKNGILAWGEWIRRWNEDRTTRDIQRNTQTSSRRLNIKISKYDDFAIALGCGIKRKDVDDCVRRYLPSTIGSGPLTIEQINEVKKDEELMGEIVFAIEEMNRAQSTSTNEPSQEEQEQQQAQAQAQAQAQNQSSNQAQAQATQGNQQHKYRGYNPIAEKIWNRMGWTTIRRNPSSFSHRNTFSFSYRR